MWLVKRYGLSFEYLGLIVWVHIVIVIKVLPVSGLSVVSMSSRVLCYMYGYFNSIYLVWVDVGMQIDTYPECIGILSVGVDLTNVEDQGLNNMRFLMTSGWCDMALDSEKKFLFAR